MATADTPTTRQHDDAGRRSGPAQLVGLRPAGGRGVRRGASSSTTRCPVVAAAVVAALVPRQHGWNVRGADRRRWRGSSRSSSCACGPPSAAATDTAAPAGGDGPPPQLDRRARPSLGADRDPLPAAPVARDAAVVDRRCVMLGDASPSRCRSCACRWGAPTTSTRTSSGCRASASTTTSRSTASRCGSCCSRCSSRRSRRTRRSARSRRASRTGASRCSCSRAAMLGVVPRARPLPLLRLLGADARPHVRHDRRLGRDEPHQERDQVLPLHDVRLGADARRHPLRGVRVRARRTAARRASTTSSSSASMLPRHVQIWLCGGVHARLRHQGADVPGAHVAARTRTPRRRRRARSSWPR